MKKAIALTLTFLMLFSLLTACGSQTTDDTKPKVSSSNDKEKPADDVTITMWTFLDITSTTNGRAMVLAKLIENFEAGHPGVKIKVETQDGLQYQAKPLLPRNPVNALT